jgi:hypothetical protein
MTMITITEMTTNRPTNSNTLRIGPQQIQSHMQHKYLRIISQKTEHSTL